MKQSENDLESEMLSEALLHLRISIDLLDCAGAPGEIAARIDFAAGQLKELVEAHSNPESGSTTRERPQLLFS